MTAPPARPWHCDEQALTAFVDGSIDPVSGASVETHLMSCGDCRGTVSRLSPPDLLEDVWAQVREAVEAPPAGIVERLLVRCGLSEETARLLAAVPAMQGAWLLGIFSATLFAILAGTISEVLGLATFLVVAPLAPLAGVAASFGGDADPAHDLVVSSPYSALRLLLLRTSGVLATAVPATIVVGLVLPGPSWLAVAWLAPAAAAVSITLALGPWLGHTTSATVVAATWALAVAFAVRMHSLSTLVEPTMQLVCLLLALAGALSVTVHYRSLGHTGSLGHIRRST